MRNLGLLFSILSFSLLVFGTVLSFWVQDPLLAKSTLLVYGILLTLSCFVIAHSLPTPEQKAQCKHNRETEVNMLYQAIDNNAKIANDDVDHRLRFINEDFADIYNRLDALESKNKKK